MTKELSNLVTNHYKEIYDEAPFIVTFKSLSLEILYTNNFTMNFTGIKSSDSIINRTDYDLPWEKFADLYSSHESKLIETGYCSPVIFPICNKDDDKSLVICNRNLMRNRQKEPIGVLTHTYIIENPHSLELSNFVEQDEKNFGVSSHYKTNNMSDNIKLTVREEECLFFFIRGKSIKSIAHALAISTRTVEIHLNAIKRKFECFYKDELIEKAISLGYLFFLPASFISKKENGLLNSRI